MSDKRFHRLIQRILIVWLLAVVFAVIFGPEAQGQTLSSATQFGNPYSRSTFRIYTCPNPAAGAEWTCTVPTGKVWRIVSLTAQLVTNGTVANRVATITTDDGTASIFSRSTGNVSQTATTTANYVAGSDMNIAGGSLGVGNAVYSPWPMFALFGQGYRVKSSTAAIDSGDDWGAPVLLVEEWPTQ